MFQPPDHTRASPDSGYWEEVYSDTRSITVVGQTPLPGLAKPFGIGDVLFFDGIPTVEVRERSIAVAVSGSCWVHVGITRRRAEEIEQLKDKTDDLAPISHEQLGKANARRLGREFRELGLEEACVAIYDGQVITTALTEEQPQETLSAIMPDGNADHPSIYYYDPG